jgi:hypothetical protein
LSSHPGQMEGKQRESESDRERVRERERVKEREEEVSPKQVPMAGVPSLGCYSQGMPNWLARHPHAKRRGTPGGVGGIPGMVPQLPNKTEQAAPRRVTLTKSEERSRSGGEQWKRNANDGWESRQGSKVLYPQSGVTWGQVSSLGLGEYRTPRPRDQPWAGASC